MTAPVYTQRYTKKDFKCALYIYTNSSKEKFRN